MINGLILQNNREIVQHIFYESNDNKSIKDRIIEKIKNKDDMKSRHQAIEFMIELCQILKSLQF